MTIGNMSTWIYQVKAYTKESMERVNILTGGVRMTGRK